MFDKILIANRGEIACRILQTTRRLGIRSVAVYSSADRHARHVRLADEALWIGEADARDSYLNIERIVAACRQSGAQAIHPGYGFLSEHASFAQACLDAGLVFIGPPPAAMYAMGLKSAARQLMEQIGVPLLPGYHGSVQEAAFLQEQATRIGYPVLLKPVAGGGGKGMHVVHQADDFPATLATCQREATSSFGDARVLIEKYLPHPRHIEIQVFADQQGHALHLFERDCSVQRRHQKVLEESPAPGMTAPLREAMCAAALNATRAVQYVGAGTIEFIIDTESEPPAFYFMEMNTRLQVEHPVTEMVTGLDLVEWQLRVAAGEPLPLTQAQVTIRGHALEARIYAEDPQRDFLPAPGTLRHLQLPKETLHLRIDRGVDAGDTITPFYDPMIAKLIVHDHNREAACQRMQQALAQLQIVGPASNVPFLSRLLSCSSFRTARLDTRLIERERHHLLAEGGLTIPRHVWLLAAEAEIRHEQNQAALRRVTGSEPNSPWHSRDGWRLNGAACRSMIFGHKTEQQEITLCYAGDALQLTLQHQTTLARGSLTDDGQLTVELMESGTPCQHRRTARIIMDGQQRHLFLDGQHYLLERLDSRQETDAQTTTECHECDLSAPMPGKIVKLLLPADTHVYQGTPLLILEAMKMEYTVVAPTDGILKRYLHAAGTSVREGTALLEFVADLREQP